MTTATVNATSVNMRDMPDATANIATVLMQGDPGRNPCRQRRQYLAPRQRGCRGHDPHRLIRADLLATAGVGGEPGNIDRSRFVAELKAKPSLIDKLNEMIRGEVGKDAPLSSHLIMVETVFNRSQMRGHDLEQGLLSVAENSRLGYYAADTYGHGGAYSRDEFIEKVLNPVIAG